MNDANSKDTVFISHANPEDNDLAVWLTLQLTNLGYKVWCDQVKFKGGEDFWGQAEEIIRNNAIRVLFITTRNSQAKEGTLKELAVADKTRKTLNTPDFIIPLHADAALSHGDFKSEIIRQISIPFTNNWAEGLKQLVDKLEKENIPKFAHINSAYVNQWWENERFSAQNFLDKPEKYTSNWLPITSLPENLYFHNFHIKDYWKSDAQHCPCRLYKDYLVTFAEQDEFSHLVKEGIYPNGYKIEETKNINVNDIIEGRLKSEFITLEDAERILISLINKAWDKNLVTKGLSSYRLSSARGTAFYPKKNYLLKDKIHFKTDSGKSSWRSFVGTKTIWPDKEYHWHYGISTSCQIQPFMIFIVHSHIIFTSDGERIISDAQKQHSLRRKVGKDWWNNDWRDRLVNLIRHFANDNGNLVIKLSNRKELICSSTFIEMESPVSYKDPDTKEILVNIPDELVVEEAIVSE